MFLSKEIDEKLIMAFELYNKKLCESLPTDEELKDITFSEAFEKKMQKLIRAQKKSYYYMINTVGKRVAIILLTLLISLTATTFGVKAIRETVIKFITETFDKSTKITVQDQEIDAQVALVKAVPQYIPAGYTIGVETDLGGFYRIIYSTQENNTIEYIQEYNYKNNYYSNTENIEFEKVNINSYEGLCYIRDGMSIVVFADSKYLYTIQGNISMEEIIKMAESIKTE